MSITTARQPNGSIVVTYHGNSALHARYGGKLRHDQNAHLPERKGFDPASVGRDDTQQHEGAALAENAVAHIFDHYWGPGTYGARDAGPYEVRWTEHGSLLAIYAKDSDDSLYVLVTGSGNQRTIHGWIYGAEAKQDCYRRDELGGKPIKIKDSWYVPASDLHSLDTIPRFYRVGHEWTEIEFVGGLANDLSHAVGA
jgi:hypothetical protein